MRIGLRAPADLDFRDKVLGTRNHRNRMAQVAFETDGLLAGVQMLAIVAAEAARRIDVTDI